MKILVAALFALLALSVPVAAQTYGPGAVPCAYTACQVSQLAISPGTLTMTSPTVWGPANAVLYDYAAEVNGTSACSARCPTNGSYIAKYDVNNTSTGTGTNFTAYTNLGGSNQVGSFFGLDSFLNVNAATGNTVTSGYYQSGNLTAIASVADNGTGGTPLGNLFALGTLTTLQTGATNWKGAYGPEFDWSIQTGASAQYAGGISAVLHSDNRVAATNENYGLLIGAQTGATPTVTTAIDFGGYQGANPFASTAVIMGYVSNGGGGTGGPTVTHGIHFAGGGVYAPITFTGNAFDSTGFAVDGSGNLTEAKTNVTTLGTVTAVAYGANSAKTGTYSSAQDANWSVAVNGAQALSLAATETVAAWTTTGIGIVQPASTFTDNTSTTGTIAVLNMNVYGGQTVAATNTGIIYTSAYGNVFNPPVAGLHVTLTQPYAAEFNGQVWMGGGNSISGVGAVVGNNGAGYQVNSGATTGTAPMYSFRGSTTSGVGEQAVGNVSLIAAGAEIVRIAASGQSFIGSAPSVTGTGTPTIATGSTDSAGEVTSGTTATSVVITFAASKTNAPFCTVTPQTQLVAFSYTISTAAITITQTATTGEKIDYHCFQH